MVAAVAFGSGVLLAQLADFLYAPVDFILIQNLLGPFDTATYAPAVQIDAEAAAGRQRAGNGDPAARGEGSCAARARRLRRYYVSGTLASFAMLLIAAAAVWAMSPMILRMWLEAMRCDRHRRSCPSS